MVSTTLWLLLSRLLQRAPVVTILIVNSDGIDPSYFDTDFKSAGLDTMSYKPPAASMPAAAWPTLGTLIDAGTRLVTFLSTTADYTEVPYLIDGISFSPRLRLELTLL